MAAGVAAELEVDTCFDCFKASCNANDFHCAI